MSSIIQVVPYNPEWVLQFQQEAQKIQSALGDNCVKIHHVGSTAISGLWAKPIIDMIPVVKDIYAVEQYNQVMSQLGFVAKGEYGMLFRRYFQRKTPLPACNIHVYEEGSGEIERLLLFKDFLNQHPDYKERYADLKRKLSNELNDITEYTLAKDALIKEIDDLTGYKGYRMVHALTPREWETYHRLLHSQTEDLDPNLKHIVLYSGTEVVGAAQIITNAQSITSIHKLAIDSPQCPQTREFFLHNLARWIAKLSN